MARLPNATPAQFTELMRLSGFPEHSPQTNAFSVLAHGPAAGGSALRLVFALLTETALDPKLRGHRNDHCSGPLRNDEIEACCHP